MTFFNNTAPSRSNALISSAVIDRSNPVIPLLV
jgi:hypothetical protein